MNETIETAYASLDFDGLERKENYRTIVYREDILHALDRKDSAAIIYQIIYRWLTEVRREEVYKEIRRRKNKNQPEMTTEEVEDMMWAYMSYNDFVRESGGAVGYNTVIRTLDYLKAKGVVEQRENHDPRYSDYEYRINKEAMNKLLQELPKFPSFDPKVPKKKVPSTQMGTPAMDEVRSTQMGTRSTQMGTRSTQMGTEVYPNGGTSHNYSHITHIEHTEESNVDVAHANIDTPPLVFHPLHSFIALDDLIAPKTMVVYLTSKEFMSEIEDDRRGFIAQEVKHSLEAQGYHVTYKWEREQERKTVDVLQSFRQEEGDDQRETLKVLIEAGIVNENDNHSHITPSQQNTPTQPETPTIVSEKPENALVSEKPSNETQAAKNGSQGLNGQAEGNSYSPTPEKPPRRRSTKKPLDLAPTLPPARPATEMPWTVEKVLAWGNYARKCAFEPSNHPQSKYYKSVEAAKKIIGQGISENAFQLIYLNWMKGVDLDLNPLPEGAVHSETWPNYSVDLWVFVQYYDDEAKKYRRAKSLQAGSLLTKPLEQSPEEQARTAAEVAARNQAQIEQYRERAARAAAAKKKVG